MGRPLSQRYYNKDLYLYGGTYDGENVLMPWAWIPGDTGAQPCWIVRQESSNSFVLEQAYPEGGNPPLQGLCYLTDSYSNVNQPGTMHIGGFVYYGGYQSGSEGYFAVAQMFDNTCTTFDGAESTGLGELPNGNAFNLPWELDVNPPPDGWMFILTSAYYWGPGS